MPVLSAVCEYKKVGSLSLKCSVFLPEQYSGRIPVVVFMHGGALIMKSRQLFSRFEQKALLKNGYAFVTVDYRTAPETKLPEIIEDIRDAFHWIRGEGAEIFHFDLERVIAMGCSAGGYLALMSGIMECKPSAIVSFYGYGDLLGDWYCKPHYCELPMVTEEMAMKGIGKNPRVWGNEACRLDYYIRARQQGTWTSLVSGMDIVTQRDEIAKYCPLYHVTADYPPTFLLHGDLDEDVPYEQSVQMYEALRKHGVPVRFYTEANGGHSFDSETWGKTPEKFDQVIEFLVNGTGE